MKLATLTLWFVVLVAPIGCASFPKPSMPSFSKKPSEATERMLSMARLMERHHKYDEALQIYEKILEKHPKQPVVCHRLGVLAVRRGEHELALEYFQQARNKEKPSAELLNDIGYTQYLTHDLESAESTLREALRANPHLESARTNLGLVLAESGREEEALVEFKKAGSEADAYANLAFVQTKLGKLSDAEKNYHRTLELNSKHKAAAEALVQYQMARDKAGAFVAALERQNPSEPETGTAVAALNMEPEVNAEEAVIEPAAAVVPVSKPVSAAPKATVAAKSAPQASPTEPTFLAPRYRHPLDDQTSDDVAAHDVAHSLFSPPETEVDEEDDTFEWAEPAVVTPAAVREETVETAPLIEDTPAKPAQTGPQTWSSGSSGVVKLKR